MPSLWKVLALTISQIKGKFGVNVSHILYRGGLPSQINGNTKPKKGDEKMRMTKELKKQMMKVIEAAQASIEGEGIWCDIEEDYVYPEWAQDVIYEMIVRLKIY